MSSFIIKCHVSCLYLRTMGNTQACEKAISWYIIKWIVFFSYLKTSVILLGLHQVQTQFNTIVANTGNIVRCDILRYLVLLIVISIVAPTACVGMSLALVIRAVWYTTYLNNRKFLFKKWFLFGFIQYRYLVPYGIIKYTFIKTYMIRKVMFYHILEGRFQESLPLTKIS